MVALYCFEEPQLLNFPETNSSPLKIDGWKMKCVLGNLIFRCNLLVSGSVVRTILLKSHPYGPLVN